jgi:arylsulfatase A-like enzyme
MVKVLQILVLFLSLGSVPARAAGQRPNILFIFTDDHCQQALSAYDNQRITTPNMDRIAAEGMRFNRCYVTNGICGPSRAVIQTGKYSHINGFMTNSQTFDGDQPTFPKMLRAAGYSTAVIGKWHLVSTPQGYDFFDVLIGQGLYYNSPTLTGGIEAVAKKKENVGYTTDLITEKSLSWLKETRNRDKPFCLMLQHKAPHRDWQPGPKYLNWLDDVEIPEPETLWDVYSNRASPAANQAMSIKSDLDDADLKLVAPKYLNEEQLALWTAAYADENAAYLEKRGAMSAEEIVKWKYQRYVKDYLRCVKSVDDSIGEVLAYLDESGLAENTVVIYSSDQGWYLGEHGWFDKRWMYEESLKAPLLVRWPGIVAPGTVNNDIVSNLDLAETFLDIAGAPIPADMQGKSLVPVLQGKTPDDWRQSFYYHYYEFPGPHSVARHYGVTDGTHKLIHYYELAEWELFDLARDPHELENLHGQPEWTATQQRLEAELTRLREQYQLPDEDPVESRRPANGGGGRPKKVQSSGESPARAE